jgi:hypothetical protein
MMKNIQRVGKRFYGHNERKFPVGDTGYRARTNERHYEISHRINGLKAAEWHSKVADLSKCQD